MTLTAKQLSKLMSELGKRTSKKKAASSAANGKKGGRPKARKQSGPELLKEQKARKGVVMVKQFDGFPEAFDYCRECGRPVVVVIKGETWKLYPSGRAERQTS